MGWQEVLCFDLLYISHLDVVANSEICQFYMFQESLHEQSDKMRPNLELIFNIAEFSILSMYHTPRLNWIAYQKRNDERTWWFD